MARYQASSKLYLCERCHDNYPNCLEIEDCNGVFCPIGMPHPPVNPQHVNDIAYPLGCGLCRSHRLTEKLYGKQLFAEDVTVEPQELNEFLGCSLQPEESKYNLEEESKQQPHEYLLFDQKQPSKEELQNFFYRDNQVNNVTFTKESLDRVLVHCDLLRKNSFEKECEAKKRAALEDRRKAEIRLA